MGRVTHESSGCWTWSGYVASSGYGSTPKRRGEKSSPEYAHRLAYELWVGPIPEGYDVDHLCHNDDESCPGGIGCLHRLCVNPVHLEAITTVDNRRRQRNVIEQVARTHCLHGHERTPENTYIHKKPDGRTARECRACVLRRNARARTSRKAKHV